MMAWFWGQIEGNVLAAPVLSAAAAMLGFVFRRKILAWWHRHLGAKADLAEIRDMAAAAHRIAADIYLHHTGRVHADAPGKRPGQ